MNGPQIISYESEQKDPDYYLGVKAVGATQVISKLVNVYTGPKTACTYHKFSTTGTSLLVPCCAPFSPQCTSVYCHQLRFPILLFFSSLSHSVLC